MSQPEGLRDHETQALRVQEWVTRTEAFGRFVAGIRHLFPRPDGTRRVSIVGIGGRPEEIYGFRIGVGPMEGRVIEPDENNLFLIEKIYELVRANSRRESRFAKLNITFVNDSIFSEGALLPDQDAILVCNILPQVVANDGIAFMANNLKTKGVLIVTTRTDGERNAVKQAAQRLQDTGGFSIVADGEIDPPLVKPEDRQSALHERFVLVVRNDREQ